MPGNSTSASLPGSAFPAGEISKVDVVNSSTVASTCNNPPALNAYRRLGYAEHLRFEERLGHRIGSFWGDIFGALRRFARNRESPPR